MTIPNAKPFFSADDIAKILKEVKVSLETGMLVSGKKVIEFEQNFSNYIGTKHAIAVNSGTAALKIALQFFNIENYQVIVPTNSFVASANSVKLSGGIPILADINPDTLCIGFDDIKNKLTSKTKGIMVVHLAGLPCPDINKIKHLCEKRGLFLIEDSAQGHGATIGNKKVGSIGDAGCFSFFPTKQMTTAEGGMITTNNSKLANFARSVRSHGIDKNLLFDKLGDNLRMTELNAILGISQLNSLDSFISKRNYIAKRYTHGLKDLKNLKIIETPASITHSYYKYPVIVDGDFNALDFIDQIYEKYGISLGTLYYPPIHLQPYYKNQGYSKRMLPNAEESLRRQICLPMFFELTDEQIDFVIESIRKEIG